MRIVTAAAGVTILAAGAALVLERIAHTQTKRALAMAENVIADVRQREVDTAAEAARVVAEAADQAQRELDRHLEQERSLRAAYREVVRDSEEQRAAADRQIARLRRENSELAEWAATVIPGPWLDWVRNRADVDAAAPDDGG